MGGAEMVPVGHSVPPEGAWDNLSHIFSVTYGCSVVTREPFRPRMSHVGAEGRFVPPPSAAGCDLLHRSCRARSHGDSPLAPGMKVVGSRRPLLCRLRKAEAFWASLPSVAGCIHSQVW